MKTRLADWLATYDSGQTVKNYRWGITAFLRNVYGDGDIEVLAERYLDDEGRDYGQDLTSFFASGFISRQTLTKADSSKMTGVCQSLLVLDPLCFPLLNLLNVPIG